jgi:hypothetical protein
MPRRLCAPSILLLVLCLLITSPSVDGGSLVVGDKVVYPGGADSPPKEKDVGIKLNAEVRGGPGRARPDSDATLGTDSDVSLPGTGSPAFAQTGDGDEQEGILDDYWVSGDWNAILSETSGRDDSVSCAYRALALFQTGSSAEARRLARNALTDEDLAVDLQIRLEELLEHPAPPVARQKNEIP